MKPRSVTFVSFGETVASSRLRARIPQQQLEKIGVNRGLDVVVYGKHLVTFDQIKHFKKKVFDCCDDHFTDQFADYYREHIEAAHLVTCNSEVMRSIIRQETGREPVVIPDPYESDEKPAGAGGGLLWFGHESNLADLSPYLDLKPEILTGSEWSREKQLAALDRCAAVLIPTGKSMAKSANRLIESTRNGRFVIAGNLPAYDEFKPFSWVGGIREGVDWFNANREQAVKMVADGQDYIRDRYSPERIGRLWLDALGQL